MKTKLGQNFLTDMPTAQREVEYANINKKDVVLEIGPGKGFLTKILSDKAKKVISIEIDQTLAQYIKDLNLDNVEIINADVLELDFNTLSKFNKIVSNIPYQISSPLTFKMLEYPFELAVLIYQKEFAERMVAKHGTKNYSRLTVNTYYKAGCKLLEIVPKEFFNPKPKVDSAMVKIIPRSSPPFKLKDEVFFFDLINNLFSQRRKKIKNIIKNKYQCELKEIPFLDKRVEELSPKEIGVLSDRLL